MSPVPFRNQPAFRAFVLAVLLAATWAYDYVQDGGGQAVVFAMVLDVVLLALVGAVCLFIFAQFVLPTKTLSPRLRIAGRLWMHAWGAHGPAVFVQNGRQVERRGGAKKAGPGLIWVDSASAALTRTDGGPGRVLGPGIHFTGRGERIEKTFSLHTQTCSVGPGQDEPIFDHLTDDTDDEQVARREAMLANRRAVSGLTRDGIEVVPEIRVVFKLEGQTAAADQPGSRFGFSGEAIERAARGEGLNIDPMTARRSEVRWNQLPALIAVDLWREYLAKFTLEDLFTSRFEPVPTVLQPEEPPQAFERRQGARAVPRASTARMLWRFNNRLQGRISESTHAHAETSSKETLGARWAEKHVMLPNQQYTALQVIAHMVWARMAQAAVPALNDSGRFSKGHALSEEYRRLRERGLRVLDVTLGGYRLPPAVEARLVQQWRTTWQDSAAGERAHVEQLEVLAAEAGRQQGLLDHARALGSALRAEPEESVPAALRALLAAAHSEILTDERLRGRGSEELPALSELTKWVDSTGNG